MRTATGNARIKGAAQGLKGQPLSATDAARDADFAAAIASVKVGVGGLEKSSRIRAAKWVERLEAVGSHVSRPLRNNYVRLLEKQISKHALQEPFLLSPPPTGLPPFPSHLRSEAGAPPPPPATKATTASPTPITPLAAASISDNTALLREIEALRRKVTKQAKEIVTLQALAVQLVEQRQEHESELRRLRSGVHHGAASLASTLASSRVAHSVSTAQDALRVRMSWTQEPEPEPEPEPTTQAAPTAPTAPIAPSSYLTATHLQLPAGATSSTPPRRYHMPPPHNRSTPSEPFSLGSRTQHESFEFLEKSMVGVGYSGIPFAPFQHLNASATDNVGSDLGFPHALNLSGGGTASIIFHPR